MHDFPFSKIETVYNLREENRQLRRAHQDMHTQLQEVAELLGVVGERENGFGETALSQSQWSRQNLIIL